MADGNPFASSESSSPDESDRSGPRPPLGSGSSSGSLESLPSLSVSSSSSSSSSRPSASNGSATGFAADGSTNTPISKKERKEAEKKQEKQKKQEKTKKRQEKATKKALKKARKGQKSKSSGRGSSSDGRAPEAAARMTRSEGCAGAGGGSPPAGAESSEQASAQSLPSAGAASPRPAQTRRIAALRPRLASRQGRTQPGASAESVKQQFIPVRRTTAGAEPARGSGRSSAPRPPHVRSRSASCWVPQRRPSVGAGASAHERGASEGGAAPSLQLGAARLVTSSSASGDMHKRAGEDGAVGSVQAISFACAENRGNNNNNSNNNNNKGKQKRVPAGPLLDVDARIAYREPGEERDAASGFWASVDDARQASTLTRRATRQLESLNGGLQATSRRMGAVAERLERWGATNGMPGAQEYREKLERQERAPWRLPLPPGEVGSGGQPRLGAPAADEPDLAGSSSSSGGSGAQRLVGAAPPGRGSHGAATAREVAAEAHNQGGTAAAAALDDAARLLEEGPTTHSPSQNGASDSSRLDALIRQQRAAVDELPSGNARCTAYSGRGCGAAESGQTGHGSRNRGTGLLADGPKQSKADEEEQEEEEEGKEQDDHVRGVAATISLAAEADEMPTGDVQEMLLGDDYDDAALLDGLLGVSPAPSDRPTCETVETVESKAPSQFDDDARPPETIVGPAARQRLRERTDRVAERIEAEMQQQQQQPPRGQETASRRSRGTEDAQLEELFLELRQLVGAVDDAAGERAEHHARTERALHRSLEDERKARGDALRRLEALSGHVMRLDARQRELARQQARREAARQEAAGRAREQHERRGALSALNMLEGQRALQSSIEALGGRMAHLEASHAKVVRALQLSERETAALRREVRESLSVQVERLREKSERERLKTQMLYDYMRRMQQQQQQQPATYRPALFAEDEGRRQRRAYRSGNGGGGSGPGAKSGTKKRSKR